MSALATDLLARQDSGRLVVFGAGVQGGAHIERLAHPPDRVRDRHRQAPLEHARPRARRTASAAGLDVRVGEPTAVRDADIVCTCTNSVEPVFEYRRSPAART